MSDSRFRTKTILLFCFTLIGIAASLLLPSLEIVTDKLHGTVTGLVSTAGLGLAGTFLLSYPWLRRDRPAGISKVDEASRVMAAFTALLVLSQAAAGWIILSISAISNVIAWANDPATGKLPVMLVASPATLFAGLTLFYFRLKIRTLYGISEVAVGITVATSQITLVSPGKSLLDFNTLIGLLTAGVYLVVRGLDNFYVGWAARPRDAFARLLGKVLFRAA